MFSKTLAIHRMIFLALFCHFHSFVRNIHFNSLILSRLDEPSCSLTNFRNPIMKLRRQRAARWGEARSSHASQRLCFGRRSFLTLGTKNMKRKRRKNGKLGFTQIENLCPAKDTIKRKRSQSTDAKKRYFNTYI